MNFFIGGWGVRGGILILKEPMKRLYIGFPATENIRQKMRKFSLLYFANFSRKEQSEIS